MRAALMYEALDVRVGQGADLYLKEAQGPQGAGAAANRQPVISTVDASARLGGASSAAWTMAETDGRTLTTGPVTR
ncbi:hypothetical protein ACIQCF_35690 [Streptomyces sp. NPDC088353]|uniref:hypothetical protein n=1 Tax=Streptomyces sp. NPDC088353 TaxID=3365855 RepID=UPI003830A619